MSKVFDEDFYTDDFDQDMIDYLIDSGWVVQGNGSRDARVDNLYLRFGTTKGHFWTTDNSHNFPLGKLLTKQQFKEEIGMTNKQGYILADGTYSSEYRVGDKFEVVNVPHRHSHYSFAEGRVITLVKDDGSDCPYFEDSEEAVSWDRLKAYKPVPEMSSKQFTKSDLRDGMICTSRNGFIYTVQGDSMMREGGFLLLNYIEDDLTVNDGSGDLDIMKVEQPTVLFTRVEAPVKSPAQIELDKLHEQIAQLQEQADKLQKVL